MGKSDLLSVPEAAKVLGVSERQARTLVQQYGGMQVGRNWIISRGNLAKVPKVRKPGPKGSAK